MKRKALIGLISGIVVLSLAVLRVYGAYQSEHDNALARAAEAEKRAGILEAEDARIKSQNDCNLEWTKYETARLEKRLADLQGRHMATPHEPFCTGHAPRVDESIDSLSKGLEAGLGAIDARNEAKLEKLYARDRSLQSRYLGLRFWAFLTGTQLKAKQAELEQDKQQRIGLEACLEHAKKNGDSKAEDLCREIFATKDRT